MHLSRSKEFIKAIRLLKYRRKGYCNMSEKVKSLLVDNMEKIGTGERPIKTASEINRAGYTHGYQQFAEAKAHDRGIHEDQLKENRKMIDKI